MSGFIKIHDGFVVGVDGTVADVAVDTDPGACSCAGCSLSGSCDKEYGKSGSNKMVIKALLPKNASIPALGSEVSVGLPSGGSVKAAVLLLVIPLAVFIAVAWFCVAAGCNSAISALWAFIGFGVCYLAAYLIDRRKTSWVLIVDKAES